MRRWGAGGSFEQRSFVRVRHHPPRPGCRRHHGLRQGQRTRHRVLRRARGLVRRVPHRRSQGGRAHRPARSSRPASTCCARPRAAQTISASSCRRSAGSTRPRSSFRSRWSRPSTATQVAGGCVLACCADHRVMARGGGRIGVTELQVGLPFPAMAFEIMRFVTPRRRLSRGHFRRRNLRAGGRPRPRPGRRGGRARRSWCRARSKPPSGWRLYVRQAFELSKGHIRGARRGSAFAATAPPTTTAVSAVWLPPESAETHQQLHRRSGARVTHATALAAPIRARTRGITSASGAPSRPRTSGCGIRPKFCSAMTWSTPMRESATSLSATVSTEPNR